MEKWISFTDYLEDKIKPWSGFSSIDKCFGALTYSDNVLLKLWLDLKHVYECEVALCREDAMFLFFLPL